MMIKWIAGIVGVSIACNIILIIIPKNKTYKAVGFVFSAIMLLCMITPIKEIKNFYSVKTGYEYSLEEFMIKLYRNKVGEIIDKYGYNFIDYSVELKNDEISLKKLQIYLPKRLLNESEENIYNNVKLKAIFSKELFIDQSQIEILWIE